MRQVPSLQLRQVFFDHLNNPKWVRALFEAGQFKAPPEPRVDKKGYIRDTPWPEVNYLARMATQVPDDVIDVFIALKKSENPWVRRTIVEVGASLSPDRAVRLAPILKAWESSGFGYRTDPRDLAALARKLLTGPKPAVGQRLARALFGPRRGDGPENRQTTLEDFWYELELPSIAEALGEKALQQLLYWLQDWEQLAGRLTDGGDQSYIFRPVISASTGGYADIENSLIDASRDAAIKQMRIDAPAAVAVLARSPLLLAKRILLHAAAEAIAGQPSELVGQIIDATTGVLDDPTYADPSFRIEFAEFIRAVAAVAPDRLLGLSGYFDRGPLGSEQRLADRLTRDDDTHADVQDRARDFTRRWRHRLLAAIGRDSLPMELQSALDILDRDDGVIESPSAPDFQTSFSTGPNSPLSNEVMAEMTADDLSQHLISWKPDSDLWNGPSHEGQGRELTLVITAKPRALDGQAKLVDRLRPLYLRAILQGWEAAVHGEEELGWQQVLEVTGGVLGHGLASPFRPDGDDFDDDADFRPAKHAAIGLIEEAVKKRDDGRVPSEVIDHFGQIVLSATSDDSAWDEYILSAPSESRDPLTLSINARWPIQLRALVHLAASAQDDKLRSAVLTQLDLELEREDPYDAVAAVVGENLPWLYKSNEEWLRSRISQLFGTADHISKNQQVALSTALATLHVHSVTLRLLRDPISAAIHLGEPIAMGWHGLRAPEQLIGEWTIITFIRGQIKIDDPLMDAFFSIEPADVRGEAIGHVAWSFMHAEEVDEVIRQRLATLWDVRVIHVRHEPSDLAELKDFYWFIRSGKFERAWWVPRLLEAVQLDPALPTRGMIGTELAAAAFEYPAETLEIVIRLAEPVGDDAEVSQYDLMENAVPSVIAAALGTDDDLVRARARSFMNQLAEHNYIDIEERVAAAQDHQSTDPKE